MSVSNVKLEHRFQDIGKFLDVMTGIILLPEGAILSCDLRFSAQQGKPLDRRSEKELIANSLDGHDPSSGNHEHSCFMQ